MPAAAPTLSGAGRMLARLWHAQVRMVEKQQRAYFKISGTQKPVAEILRESAAKNFAPLFRGTVPLMGHSFASAMLGLVGQLLYTYTHTSYMHR
jgi:hypothetical protein